MDMMKKTTRPVSRRAFLERGTVAAAAAGLSTVAARAAAAVEENPWRYDVDRLRRVDPALIHYERTTSFETGLVGPRRLAVGGDGRLMVAAGRSLLLFGADGTRQTELALEGPARAVRFAADGRIFVGLRDRVEVLDAKGRRVAAWPAFQGKPFLTGLALGERDVFVADAGNRVVYRCDFEGRVNLRLGEKNLDRKVPGLVLPSPFLDVELGVDGLLRINNPGRHKVETYSLDGELVASWGRPGVAIDSFCGCCNPINLALLPDGRCVTAEKGLPRVKVYASDGRLESVVAGPDQFAAVASEERDVKASETTNDGLDVALDGEGRLWVLDLVGGTLQAFRPKPASGRAA
jgi:hypothetical protein